MKKVAILVPTKDRLDFVIRLINYYVSINSPHPIFIGDASSESSKELVSNATQGKIDVFYFHWEKLNDRKTLVKLGEQAIKINLTNYCAYHGDDDFFIPESLSKCADFLDENPEYRTSQGRAFSFALDRDGPYGKLEKIGIYWDVRELNGDTALDRLYEIISKKYWVPIFSVHRINEYIDDMSNGVDAIIDRDFGEYANSLTIAMRGKSKFIECLYLARNTHSRIEHPTKLDWITGENWHLSYTELINLISEVLSRIDKMSMIESNFEAKLQVDKLLLGGLFPQKSASHVIRKKIIEFLDNKKSISALSKFYRRIKYISISTFYLMISITKSSKSKYYRDISFIVNSCKSKNRN